MVQRPPILYKYLNAKGAKAFLKQPQLRFKHFLELDDLMEIIPGFRRMSEAEVQKYATIKAQQLGNKLSAEKCAIFLRHTSRLDPTYWENGMRALLEKEKLSIFVCSMTDRCDS